MTIEQYKRLDKKEQLSIRLYYILYTLDMEMLYDSGFEIYPDSFEIWLEEYEVRNEN